MSHLKDLKEMEVRRIFNAIAPRYDLTNALMSWGVHRYWQNVLLRKIPIPKGGIVLDLCCGTGSIAIELTRRIGPNGRVTGVDFSEAMLGVARKRLSQSPLQSRIEWVNANALDLPFDNDHFDCVTIAYGLRNISDVTRVLSEIKRVLKPGGWIGSLEMTPPESPVINKIYEFYLNHWIPYIGGMLSNNRPAYQYLHDSIRQFHPDRITDLLHALGFKGVCHLPLTLGIASIHTGRKQ